MHEGEQQWQVTTNKGAFEHSVVVIANGHLYDQFTQSQSLPLGKVKGQVSHIPTNEHLQKLKTVVCYDGYLTPKSPLDKHCIGASYDRSDLTNAFDPQAQQQNAAKLQQCLPEQEWTLGVDVSGNDSRQGVRSVSRDHLPFAGNVGQFEQILEQYESLNKRGNTQVTPVSQYTNLFCLLGLGSRGLTSAPMLAEVLASQILQQPLPLSTDMLEVVHPSRMWVRKLRKGKPIPGLDQ